MKKYIIEQTRMDGIVQYYAGSKDNAPAFSKNSADAEEFETLCQAQSAWDWIHYFNRYKVIEVDDEN